MLKKEGQDAFNEIYERYWEKLYLFVFNRINSKDVAFEITQEIFVSLWVRRNEIEFHTSLSGYLYAATRYQIIHYIKSSKLKADYLLDFVAFRLSIIDNSNEETVNLHELERAVEKGLEGLPKRCQEIFRMSRQDHKSIQEISEQLNISHKTVENQLTFALKHLRVSLQEFMAVFLFILFR
ncbi:MAG TPA: RNA polymerase sigma-70 factor [Chryseolinea sp.]|nr:RNA polymerase sigma-70 factor [Chryseolinea sp.]